MFENININKCYFNPGCAISIYKPDIAKNMFELLKNNLGDVKYHDICCHHNPKLEYGSVIINNCAGCDRRFGTIWEGIGTITFWEVIDSLNIKLPDWQELEVSIHDSCSFRKKTQVHKSVRNILTKMNIKIIESEFSCSKSVCCGDDLYGKVPNKQVIEAHKKRAEQFPSENVVVYCIGCVRAITEGGKNALYLPDLIFSEKTKPMRVSLDDYHLDLDKYIGCH